MFHYVYYPFPKESALSANASVLKRYAAKYSSTANNAHAESDKNRKGNILRYRGEKLGDLANDDMLMISSHGGATDPTKIVSDKGAKEAFNEAEKLTANDLATQLAAAELPKGHVLIKMLSCYAGGVLTASADGPKRSGMGETGEDFFAKLLAMALRANHLYNAIIVGGYAGPLLNSTVASRRAGRGPISSHGHLYAKVGVKGGDNVDAHDHMHWFSGDGATVPRETITRLKLESDLRQGAFAAAPDHLKKKGIATVFKRF